MAQITLNSTGVASNGALVLQSNGTTAAVTISTAQNLTMAGRTTNPTTISIGAATPSTSGAGITFPATESASSDANTLDDYEEGTWTPTNIGGSLAVVGTFSSSGIYTKIGKVVTVSGTLNGTTSVAITGGGNVVCGGLPYSAAANTLCAGSAVNSVANATASLYANSNVNVGSVTAMAATTSIFFSIVYFV